MNLVSQGKWAIPNHNRYKNFRAVAKAFLSSANPKNYELKKVDPPSPEKQFSNLSFSKNITPLLKSKKIDFALVFAVNKNQLNGILKDVISWLKKDSKLWVAFPKSTSKIFTDLNFTSGWDELTSKGYERTKRIEIDQVWSAMRFMLTPGLSVRKSPGGKRFFLL